MRNYLKRIHWILACVAGVLSVVTADVDANAQELLGFLSAAPTNVHTINPTNYTGFAYENGDNLEFVQTTNAYYASIQCSGGVSLGHPTGRTLLTRPAGAASTTIVGVWAYSGAETELWERTLNLSGD